VEKPDGVIVQFGGQTPLNLAHRLDGAGVPIVGTSVASIELAENREKFADRFFLTYETIKGWERGKRITSGPALVILQQIEAIVEAKKAESREVLAEYRRGLK